jgi:hypothetical protein
MTSEGTIIKFWDVVVECLVEFHGFDHANAHKKAIQLRGSLRELDRPTDMVCPSDIVYHEEPFYIACNLTNKELNLGDYQERYNDILKRHGW